MRKEKHRVEFKDAPVVELKEYRDIRRGDLRDGDVVRDHGSVFQVERIPSLFSMRQYYSHSIDGWQAMPGWDTRWHTLGQYDVMDPEDLPEIPYFSIELHEIAAADVQTSVDLMNNIRKQIGDADEPPLIRTFDEFDGLQLQDGDFLREDSQFYVVDSENERGLSRVTSREVEEALFERHQKWRESLGLPRMERKGH